MIDERLKNKDWRLSNLYKIVDKNKKLIKFNKNKIQDRLDKNKWFRNIILKARQEGITTYECIDGLDDVLFTKNFTMVIIAHELEAVKKIFKKIKLAWEYFPENLKSEMGYVVNSDNANELSFNNGSSIRVALSSRSDTVNRLHISEFGKICAKYPQKAEEIITGAIPSVPENGRIDIESTAEGEFGEFYEMFWEAWYRGNPQVNKQFKAFFFGWNEHIEYQLEGNFEIPQDLRLYQSKHNLTNKQINWYFIERGVLKDKMKQENPTTPEEAFESSGSKMFDLEQLDWQRQFTVEGVKIGDWTFYKPYIPSHSYALAGDVAEGLGQDSSTGVIIDFTTSEVVGEYCSNQIAPDMFGYELFNGSNKFGGCLIAPERNNHGHTTISTLKTLNANIFEEETLGKVSDKGTKKLGWHTNGASKPKMLYELSEAINEQRLKIPSKSILNELRTYDRSDLSVTKFDPDQSRHWDRVIALAIAWQMRLHARKAIVENVVDEIFDRYSVV